MNCAGNSIIFLWRRKFTQKLSALTAQNSPLSPRDVGGINCHNKLTNFNFFLSSARRSIRDKTTAKNRRCKVIYSYKESKDDELTLAVGDLIEVYEEVRMSAVVWSKFPTFRNIHDLRRKFSLFDLLTNICQ